jgi:tyrosyl-tRNA synthetase
LRFAEYEYLRLKFSIEVSTLPKAERKKKSKEIIKNYKPTLSFDTVRVRFENYLFTNNRDWYSTKELQTFIENYERDF